MLQLDRPPTVRFAFAITLALALLLASNDAVAARIKQTKNTQALIDLEGADAKVGDKFFAMDSGKKRALLEITQLKSGRALARIVKGKAQAGYELQAIPSAGGDAAAGQASDKEASQRSRKRRSQTGMYVGGLLGYGMDTQSVKVSNAAGTASETDAMTGSGFSGKGVLDMPVAGDLGLIARLGAETFSLTGSSVLRLCGGTANCSTSITYLTGDLLLRYSFPLGTFTPYLAAGFGLHFPITKSSNILDESKISATTVAFGGGGVMWKVGEDSYIPIHIEYGYFLGSSGDVTTSLISARIGYLVRL